MKQKQIKAYFKTFTPKNREGCKKHISGLASWSETGDYASATYDLLKIIQEEECIDSETDILIKDMRDSLWEFYQLEGQEETKLWRKTYLACEKYVLKHCDDLIEAFEKIYHVQDCEAYLQEGFAKAKAEEPL